MIKSLLTAAALFAAATTAQAATLIDDFNDGALNGLHARLLQQAIEIVKTALLGAESNAHRREVAVAGVTNQTFAPLGQVLGIHARTNHVFPSNDPPA